MFITFTNLKRETKLDAQIRMDFFVSDGES